MSTEHDHGDQAPTRSTGPATHAAGWSAVRDSMRQSLTQMGVGRTFKTLLRVNQRSGFDCPGCAWPDPEGHRHIAEFCEEGAKAVAEEATKERADAGVFARYSVAEMEAHSDFWIGKLGRLTEPMYLGPGETHYRPVSWDEAYDVIVRNLKELDSPGEAIFYTSGRTSNEAAFLYQAFVRAFGTNNLPDCSNMCHESSGSALIQTIGIGKGSVTLDSLEHADLIIVAGQNAGTNSPRMLSALDIAKQRGAKIVSVNPLPEAGMSRFDNPQTLRGMLGLGRQLADLHLQIRLNGDMALFQALSKRLIERDAIDHEFIEQYCSGFDELRAHLARLDQDLVRRATALTDAEIDELTEMAIASQRTVVIWGMGLTQHKNSVATIRDVVNFLLLRGNIGKLGAGVCPVRGHSNVQGDRTMGINDHPAAPFLDRMEEALGFPMPREHGYNVVNAIKAMRDGVGKVFIMLGGNFVSATSDTEVCAAGMRRCRLTVSIATKPNRSHFVHGREALILPALGRTELDTTAGYKQFVTVEDSMMAVHATRGGLEPASPNLRSEVQIVCDLASRVVGDIGVIRWGELHKDYSKIRDLIEAGIAGFDQMNDRIAAGGFTLPHPPRDSRTFKTDTGRAKMTVNQLELLQAPKGALILQTVRNHGQYNTTIYELNDRYRGIHAGRRVVMVNPEDMAEAGVSEGEIVDVIGIAPDGIERRADRFRVVSYSTPRGCVAAYWPEANVLVPLDSVVETSGTPVSKAVMVRFVPHVAEAAPAESAAAPEAVAV